MKSTSALCCGCGDDCDEVTPALCLGVGITSMEITSALCLDVTVMMRLMDDSCKPIVGSRLTVAVMAGLKLSSDHVDDEDDDGRTCTDRSRTQTLRRRSQKQIDVIVQ